MLGGPLFGVSILVFVELALDDPDFEYFKAGVTVVSILVFVELALDVGLVHSILGGKQVSILVFVELALDERLFFVLFPV